jgi:glycosyltransferase involved in cell wall biosynthesis
LNSEIFKSEARAIIALLLRFQSQHEALPRKVLFLTSWFPSKKHPSLGNFVLRHAQAAALNHSVDVLYVTALPGAEGVQVEEEQVGEVRIWRLYHPPFKGRGKLSGLVKAGLYMRYWRQLIRKYIHENGKPDIAHLNVMFPAGRVARELKLRYDIPYVVSEHWTGYLDADGRYGKLPWVAKRMIRNTALAAEQILPVSEDLESALIRHGLGSKFRRLPNVIDTNLFAAGAPERSKRLRLLHISNLHPEQKNIRGLMSVLSRWKQEFELTLVGEEGAEEAKKLAREFGLSERIRFEQKLSQEGVVREMQQHHCFILFSNFENLPCVLIEAASSGLKIVSSDVGGISEYFNEANRNAMLVPAGNEPALLEALEHVGEFNWLDSSELHQWTVEHFGMKEVGRQLNEVYEEVLSK